MFCYISHVIARARARTMSVNLLLTEETVWTRARGKPRILPSNWVVLRIFLPARWRCDGLRAGSTGPDWRLRLEPGQRAGRRGSASGSGACRRHSVGRSCLRDSGRSSMKGNVAARRIEGSMAPFPAAKNKFLGRGPGLCTLGPHFSTRILQRLGIPVSRRFYQTHPGIEALLQRIPLPDLRCAVATEVSA
jgi:hypothetical protein